MANDSGKYSGENRIGCRGRKYLRYVLYKAAILLIGKNVQFWDIHKYYQNEKENPLKKRQLVVVATCKVIRVFYVILTKEAYYDAEKLI